MLRTGPAAGRAALGRIAWMSQSQGPTEAMIRQQIGAVPRTVPRQKVDDVIRRYFESYERNDVEARVALFTDDLVFEDPVGMRLASTKDELRRFFRSLQDRGVSLSFSAERVVVVGDACLIESRVVVRGNDGDGVPLTVFVTLYFAPDGHIQQLRSFFDENCIGGR